MQIASDFQGVNFSQIQSKRRGDERGREGGREWLGRGGGEGRRGGWGTRRGQRNRRKGKDCSVGCECINCHNTAVEREVTSEVDDIVIEEGS